ncbi:RING finger protein 151 [Engraulis encrasicolus]|uniref:RING finger protein 151 n=1 Tax=Engraulis encrasicolus TaxID=184585 RepID=UPI002FD2CBBD
MATLEAVLSNLSLIMTQIGNELSEMMRIVQDQMQSGGYEVDLFVEPPDYDLICIICRGVLRCPVRVACNHIFCKKCILQWLKRQETCPCCRKTVNQNFMFVMFRLSKAIGRLQIKCRNSAQGCAATFALSEEYLHSSTCPFETVLCPHSGCGERVLRSGLEAHARLCPHWSQLCPMGCGTQLSRATQPQHNCYRELRQRYEAQRSRQRAIAAALRRKMARMQNTMAHMRRQVGLICDSLEVLEEEREEEQEQEEDSPGEGTSSYGSGGGSGGGSSRASSSMASRTATASSSSSSTSASNSGSSSSS